MHTDHFLSAITMASEPQRTLLGLFLPMTLTLLLCFSSSQALKFKVGGKDGWVVKPSEDYNSWSGRNRFQVNDTLYFKYKKGYDSVLVVNKTDYDSCNTQNPMKKMDDGDSHLTFDKSGPLFFISGNSENCKKGQKLIVVVLGIRHKTPSSPHMTAPAPAPAPAPSPAKGNPPTVSPGPTNVGHKSPAPSPAEGSPPTVSPGPSDGPTVGNNSPAPSPAGGNPPTVSPGPGNGPNVGENSPAPSSSPAEGNPPTVSPSPGPSNGPTVGDNSPPAPTPAIWSPPAMSPWPSEDPNVGDNAPEPSVPSGSTRSCGFGMVVLLGCLVGLV